MLQRFLLSGFSLILLVLVGCGSDLVGASPPAPSTIEHPPSPTFFIVKTVVGKGLGTRGPLSIEGDCVRVNGKALAWKPMLEVKIMGDALRVRRILNGQVSVLHVNDEVEVLGGCTYKGEGVESRCVTPSVEEAGAVTGCDTGPYFLVDNIKKILTPTPIPPSP